MDWWSTENSNNVLKQNRPIFFCAPSFSSPEIIFKLVMKSYSSWSLKSCWFHWFPIGSVQYKYTDKGSDDHIRWQYGLFTWIKMLTMQRYIDESVSASSYACRENVVISPKTINTALFCSSTLSASQGTASTSIHVRSTQLCKFCRHLLE